MTGHSEEDEFAAALDSEAESEEEQEAGGMLLGNVVADRHGFQEPQAPPAMLHSAPGGLVQVGKLPNKSPRMPCPVRRRLPPPQPAWCKGSSSSATSFSTSIVPSSLSRGPL
jgi:hypothetical protein